MAGARANKEKVLHTRVPEVLDAQIKALADALRVPVSSLVRNILEDSVAVIDSATSGLDETLKTVTANVRTLSEHARADQKELRRGFADFQSLLSEAFKARRDRDESDAASTPSAPQSPTATVEERPSASALFPEVLGWQTLTLNLAAPCARCASPMIAGDTAHLGVREAPGPRVLICARCLPKSGPARDAPEPGAP